MIARVWRGSTRTGCAGEYVRYLHETGVRDCRRTSGNCGVVILRDVGPLPDGTAEFVFVSFWDSLASIRGFAGDAIDKAVFYPRDQEFLIDRESTVRHYDVAVSNLPRVEPRFRAIGLL
jgi:heme-degrading monooxygenase HmoA